MPNKRSRSRAHRRDRRKARASGWARQPKPMGGRVGHGSAGTTRTVSSRPIAAQIGPVPHHPRADIADKHRLKIPLGDLARVDPRRKR